MDTSKVNRFEVIDHTNNTTEFNRRLVVKRNIRVTASLQDDGQTLKIFLNDGDPSELA